MFARGLQSEGMKYSRPLPEVDLRDADPADADFMEALARIHLAENLGAPPGVEAGPLLEMQMRSRAMMLEHSFPDLRQRVGQIGDAPVAVLLTAIRDGALHVVEIATAPRWRRRGVGAALLERVAAEARAGGQDATAHIFVTNTASLGLFSGAGFTLTAQPGAAQVVARLRTGITVTPDIA
jgi:ribosomal protein S18 acetylase RimI-like enzyme